MPTNLEPCSAESLVKMGEVENLHKANYGSIAKAADMSEQALIYILRQIIMAVESATRKEYNVKLNLRVGFLKFRHGQMCFENMATAQEIDSISKTTSNTLFRQNKYHMTNLGNGVGNDYDEQITYRSESIKDAISRISKPRTPKTSAGSVVSLKSQRFAEMIAGRANPNTIDLKTQERQARMLNSIVEGKYSKRMSIQGKDMYKDLDVLRNHRRDLLDQALTKKESIFANKT